MKRSKNSLVFPSALLSLLFLFADSLMAQTFTTLHNFSRLDGSTPYADLNISGNTLYGTTQSGGSLGYGVVFAINTNGSNFTNLFNFTAGMADAVGPGGLFLSGTTLYGAAQAGYYGAGEIFKISCDGTGYTNLFSFAPGNDTGPDTGIYTNSNGAALGAGLISSGNRLYGTALEGTLSGNGTVFAVNTDGTAFTNLHNFTVKDANGFNSDGASAVARLTLSGNTLYGVAESGGSSGEGLIFKINTDGAGFTVLHNFKALVSTTNSDGAVPHSYLTLAGNQLYGIAIGGGFYGAGTVFVINTNGTSFTNLHSFAAANYGNGFTNREGAHPTGGLVLSGNTLFGTANSGGTLASGTIYKLHTDGTAFSNLHNFNASTDGSSPYAGLILAGNTLYGAASGDGSLGNGTVFSLTLPTPPPLKIIYSSPNIILSWPTNSAGLTFTLQTATKLTSSAVWTNVAPASVVVNGQNTVTNPTTGTQQFYRLSQ